MQVDRSVDLGPQRRVHPLGRQHVDDTVVDARGVRHGRQRTVGRNPGQQPGQRLPVGRVACGDGGLCAQLDEFRHQFGHTVGGGAAAAGEQQMAGAVRRSRGFVISSAETTLPVRLETIGMRGAS
ncbi:hypothetical protein SANTM175S_08506 [Streptomyces antimycoticus]